MAGKRSAGAPVRVGECEAWLPFEDDGRFRWELVVLLTRSRFNVQAAVRLYICDRYGRYVPVRRWGETIAHNAHSEVLEAWIRSCTQAFLEYDGKDADEVYKLLLWNEEMAR